MLRLPAVVILVFVLCAHTRADDPSRPAAGENRGEFPVPAMTPKRTDVKPFEYVDVGKKIPNYTPGKKWGTQGEPHSSMQLPLPPEESIKHFIVPQGFHVELFAAEPDIGGKPIAMNWDERGRLWLIETRDYPNELQPRGAGRDRIRICADTDGDGRADRFTVFAEQLSIPTSLSFARGGVIVFDGTQTVFLKDTDGDDVADERRVLFEGWSLGDTHGGPSNMQYGLDNWIWAMQGYNLSRLTVGGQVHEFRQGFLRFKPDGSQLEFIRSTDNNTWGLGMSEEGIVFGSTANRNPSVYMPIANRYYERVRGWTPSLVLPSITDSHLFKAATNRVRQVDHFGGYTAGAGHALYTARAYPREYWNRTAFVCEPTGHLVGTFVIAPDGAGFRSSNRFNLLASDDEWSAPTMAEVGPDGNVWVIDWYNYIVQHNPTPLGFKTGKGNAYDTDLRDKKHGRIYRVVYDGSTGSAGAPRREQPHFAAQHRSPQADFALADAPPQRLVETLSHPNLFWRRHAQRLLVERGERDIVPELIALVSNESCDEIGLNVGAIHALWTLHGLGALGTDAERAQPMAIGAAVAALRYKSPGVRRNAVAVLPIDLASSKAILKAGLLTDSEPQVRLAALLAIAERPSGPHLGEALISVLANRANVSDRWIHEAAICAAAVSSDSFLAALGGVKSAGDSLLAAAAIIAKHRARSGPFDSVDALAASLAEMDGALAEAVVRGLSAGWPKNSAKRPRLTTQAEDALARAAEKLSVGRRAALVELAGRWGSQRFQKYAAQISAALVAQLQNNDAPLAERVAAASQLIAYRPDDADCVLAVLDQVTPKAPVELAVGLIRATAASQADSTGQLLLERCLPLTPAVRSAAVATLLGRPAWTLALVENAEQGKLQVADLTLDQQRLLSDHPAAAIRRRVREWLKGRGALVSADRQKVLDEMLSVASEHGDAAAGKVVYNKHCAKCHVHGELGQRIGPDLTGMAVHSKQELLTSILDPSRSVEGNFRVYTLATLDGRVLSGLLASESKTAIELVDVEAKRRSILREEIDELAASNKSLMPDGFEKQLSRTEMVDLLEFLAARGRYVPLPLDKVATATTTRGMFNSPAAEVERLVFDDWKPRSVHGVPFQLVDPDGQQAANAIVLFSPQGEACSKMPKSVSVPCNVPAKAIHLLGGVSGWGHPLGEPGSVSMIVRLVYEDGQAEDHPLRNGEHLADYVRRVDVPGSEFAFDLRGRQLRYLAIAPKRGDVIERIELVKGTDDTAPVVMAITLEASDQ